MKKFNFLKILYYGFMIFIVLILTMVLPSYNQFNAIVNAYNGYVENEEFDKIPGFYSLYYDKKNLVKKDSTINDSSFIIYNGITNVKASESESYTLAHKAIGGIILNTYGFRIDGVLNSSTGKKDYLGHVIYKDSDSNIYKQAIDESQLRYISSLDSIYFEMSEYEMTLSNLKDIKEIQVYDNEGREFAKVETSFSFEAQFFNELESFVEIFNRNYYDIDLKLTGSFDYKGDSTAVKSSSTIEFEPSGATKLLIDGDGFDITGASKLDDLYVTSSNNVKITFNENAILKKITLVYSENSITYSFDDSIATYSYKTDLRDNVLGGAYNKDKQQSDYEVWRKAFDLSKEENGFASTEFDKAMKNTTFITVVQALAFVLIMLIIGDFIVGKHKIIHLVASFFGKREKKMGENINPNYDVNVSIIALVPEGYSSDINLKYMKDNDHIIDVTLSMSTGYRYDSKYQNGRYKLVSYDSPLIHLKKPQKEIQISGYNFKLELEFMLSN